MKNIRFFSCIIIIGILIIIYGFSKFGGNEIYYYSYNEKTILLPSENKIAIRYNKSKEKLFRNLNLPAYIEKDQIEWYDDSTLLIITRDIKTKNRLLNEKSWQNDIVSLHPVYKDESGLEMYVTNEILVKFLENTTQEEIGKIHKYYNVKVLKSDENYQLLQVPSNSDALEISLAYQESGLVLFSEPNFISKLELFQVPNDEFFNLQFYLNNTGQIFTDGHWGTIDADIDAPEAWTITQGNNNIIIAVIDQGVSPNHPDLPNARQVRLNNSNLADGDPNNPSATANSNHGNACAGIIAATRNNNQGISGIAPNCMIMPIRIFNTDETGVTVDRVATSINFARQNGAHIISNSWGYPSSNQNLHPAIVEAIRAATTTGRGNLGCVVVFAAGNNARHTVGDNGFVQFPANVNIEGVLTVGASDRNDLQADYSPTSSLIEIVAPSHRAYPPEVYISQGTTGGIAGETFEVMTIDIPENAGYNPYPDNPNWVHPPIVGEQLPNAGTNFLSYTARMGGTSAACPQVAGVAALILSINPNITQMQVFNIITSTADRVGGYTYTNGRSNELGFGRLNACRAVMQAASTIQISGNSVVCSSNSTFSLNNIFGETISWTHSPNLAYVNGQGTNSYTVIPASSNTNGIGWVEATIFSPCNQISARKDVWVGIPSISYIDGPQHANSAQSPELYFALPLNTLSNASYSWQVNPYYYSLWASLNWANIGFPYDGDFTVSVNAQNACGTTNSVELFVAVGIYEPFKITPNPVSDFLTISLTNTQTSDAFNDTNNSRTSIETNSELTVQVINSMGFLVYSTRTSGSSFKVPTFTFKDGHYIIIISDGKSRFKKSFIVKH